MASKKLLTEIHAQLEMITVPLLLKISRYPYARAWCKIYNSGTLVVMKAQTSGIQARLTLALETCAFKQHDQFWKDLRAFENILREMLEEEKDA